MKTQQILVTVIAILFFTGAGFFGGMKYQQSRMFKNIRGNGNGNGQFMMRLGNGGPNGGSVAFGAGQGQRGRNGGMVNGEIISSDDKSITVRLPDGSSKIVLFTGSTSINKASEGTVADFKAGEKVAAFGTVNNDGSVTASNIQLNPIMRGLQASPSPAQ